MRILTCKVPAFILKDILYQCVTGRTECFQSEVSFLSFGRSFRRIAIMMPRCSAISGQEFESEPVLMRQLQRFWVGFLDPRKFLFAAVLTAAAGIVAGYVEVQQRADRELALRQGAPVPVLIQDFRLGYDTGPASEIRVRGELDLSAAVVTSVRGADASEQVFLAPLFPLSDYGAVLLEDAGRSGVSALQAQVGRRGGEGQTRPSAIGLVVVPLDGAFAFPGSGAEWIAEEVSGTGRYGTVVNLNGSVIDPGDLTLVAHGAFAAQEIILAEVFLGIEPYMNGRVAALTAADPSQIYRYLYMLALTLVALAAGLQVGRAFGLQFGEDMIRQDWSDGHDVLEPAAPHPKFAPIQSQNEILAADRVAAEKTKAPSVLARLFQRALAGISAFARWVRNRPSRQEDEAL